MSASPRPLTAAPPQPPPKPNQQVLKARPSLPDRGPALPHPKGQSLAVAKGKPVFPGLSV